MGLNLLLITVGYLIVELPIQFSCVKFRSKKSFYGSAATGSSHGYVGLGPVDYFFGGDFFAFLIKSLESQNSTSGYIEFEELAFNGTANIKVWSQVGVEAGSTFFSLVTSPEKDMENPIGVGLLYGLTYLLNEELQLRIRREDKLLKNSYDIQPGYSFSISYLFD